jgi:hypothetical protein
MKKLIAMSTLILLALCLFTMMSHAQDEPKKYQGYVVWEDRVFPSHAEAYETVVKKQIALIREHSYERPIYIFSRSDYAYFWSIPIDHFADIDTLYKFFSKVYSASEEAAKEIEAGLDGTFEYSRPWVAVWQRELSYIPEVMPEENLDFVSWGMCYVNQSKGDEMREVFKKWVELYKSKGIEMGFNVYIGDIGTDMPFMFWDIRDKNPQSFYEHDRKINEILGEEANKLWAETESLLRGFEQFTGWYRRDLSYMPGN